MEHTARPFAVGSASALLLTALVLTLVGCGQPSEEPSPWLSDPAAPLPEWLSDAGIFADLSRLSPAAGFVPYSPPHRLYSNGSDKARLLYLPPGEQIATDDPGGWRFPIGAVLVKTFTHDNIEGRRGPVAVETRVVAHRAQGWVYAVYHWSADGEEGRLAPPRWSNRPLLLTDPTGSEFEYDIPGELDCATCHDTHHAGPVIGLGPENLDPALIQRGVFQPAPTPSDLPARSAAEAAVMSYMQGNCVHCHHGEPTGDNASFSLRPADLVATTVDVATDSSASGVGTRVIPGDPEGSALFEAVVGSRADDYAGDFKPMPPAGIVYPDPSVEALLRAWIDSL